MCALRKFLTVAALGVIAALAICSPAQASAPFVAFSLGVAEARLKASPDDRSVTELGGITAIAGAVYDTRSGDILIVGQAVPGRRKLTIDDFAVALRATLKDDLPAVSIDKTGETAETRKQRVVYRGGIDSTQFGADFLSGDVTLKKLAINKLPLAPLGLRSYFDGYLARAKAGKSVDQIGSRFWFVITGMPEIAEREHVLVVRQFKVGLRTEVLSATVNGKPVEDLAAIRDETGDAFAAQMTSSFNELALFYPEIARVKALLDLVSLARGLQQNLPPVSAERDLRFWATDYRIATVVTDSEFPLLTAETKLPATGGAEREIVIEGGVEARVRVLKLRAGDPIAFRDLIINSRPGSDSLSWPVPLDGWMIPDAVEAPEDRIDASRPRGAGAAASANDLGFSLLAKTIPAVVSSGIGLPPGSMTPLLGRGAQLPTPPGPSRLPLPELPSHTQPAAFAPPPMPTEHIPPVTRSAWPMPTYSPHIGGVMLSGVAQLQGATGARVDLSHGNFAFVVDGGNAELSPEAFDRFVNALWAVYFSRTAPGISIDPICWPSNAPECKGIDRHLVRYIGEAGVLNTDLGRVMREADYLMKKWAIGTERPDIRGFRDVDDLSWRYDAPNLNARRFWFISECLRFKRGSDQALLFDGGRMTLKTRLLAADARTPAPSSTPADCRDPSTGAPHAGHKQVPGDSSPTDRAFADFFTANYDAIAKRYPIYSELMDYAKLVALAQYLKQSGVPLYWFLLANKDLIITEDSPGTVQELAKGSKNFRGVEIHGGVDLGSSGRYLIDAQAAAAIGQALRQAGPRPAARGAAEAGVPTPATVPPPLELDRDQYTVAPQHALTSGKDARGIRYQTDLALRQPSQPGVEVVRFFDPMRREGGEFGNGWRLLVPYRVRADADAGREQFRNVTIPRQMIVENLVDGSRETLIFSADRYAIAGYVPADAEQSRLIGLFLLSDGSFRLGDKVGNEFQFDGAGFNTDILISESYHVHIDYAKALKPADFLRAPYTLVPDGAERVQFRNVTLPKHLALRNELTGAAEIFEFSDQGRIAGYVPASDRNSRYTIIALMSDGSFRQRDKHLNEAVFDPSGEFTAFVLADGECAVQAMSQANQRVDFRYMIAPDGSLRIAELRLEGGATGTSYEYDEDGRLAQISEMAMARLQ